MGEEALISLDARTLMCAVVARAHAEEATFVVLRHHELLYAFRVGELVAWRDSTWWAYIQLALVPEGASQVRTAQHEPEGRPERQLWLDAQGTRLHPDVLYALAEKPALIGSAHRIVYLDTEGRPIRVEEKATLHSALAQAQLRVRPKPTGSPRITLPPISRDVDENRSHTVDVLRLLTQDPDLRVRDGLAGEGTSITRYPSIDVAETGAEVTLVIDLELACAETTLTDPVRFAGLPDDWKELAVTVRVASPHLEFADGDDDGTIRVRRDRPSVKCRLAGHRRPEARGPLEVTVAFFHGERWCGTARRTFAGVVRAHALTGTIAIMPGAQAPDLTVHIHRTEANHRCLVWLFAPAAAHRVHVRRALAESSLDDEPAPYVRALFRAAAGSKPGAHVSLLQGVGERLWARAPEAFHDAYWAMRDALGDGFTIQFLTDEPYLPWELMRPVRRGTRTQLLAETHPVARGLLAYPDRLRPWLPAKGAIFTMAPDYERRALPSLPPLIAACEESELLQTQFRATAIAPASARAMLDALVDRTATPVKLLHFAGHARVEAQIDQSRILCEDDDVTIAQVRRQDTLLGERYGTFVVFNACEVGAAGEVLGEVGGWAEAFAYREFSGFVAPLWAVFDEHAKVAMTSFFEAILEQGVPVGEALRDMRAEHGPYSPTSLSYVYYGDVNARFS